MNSSMTKIIYHTFSHIFLLSIPSSFIQYLRKNDIYNVCSLSMLSFNSYWTSMNQIYSSPVNLFKLDRPKKRTIFDYTMDWLIYPHLICLFFQLTYKILGNRKLAFKIAHLLSVILLLCPIIEFLNLSTIYELRTNWKIFYPISGFNFSLPSCHTPL